MTYWSSIPVFFGTLRVNDVSDDFLGHVIFVPCTDPTVITPAYILSVCASHLSRYLSKPYFFMKSESDQPDIVNVSSPLRIPVF